MTIEDNIATRQATEEITQVLLDYVREVSLTPDAKRDVFVRVHHRLTDLLGLPSEQPVSPVGARPMDDDECKAFEKMIMPFGVHQGKWMGDVPLRYLDWLIGEKDIKQDIRRYLANRTVAQLLENER